MTIELNVEFSKDTIQMDNKGQKVFSTISHQTHANENPFVISSQPSQKGYYQQNK